MNITTINLTANYLALASILDSLTDEEAAFFMMNEKRNLGKNQ